MNRISPSAFDTRIEDTCGLNDIKAAVLASRESCKPREAHPKISDHFPSGCHSQETSARGGPPFPLRAFTARHSILHLMVHPSFAHRHLDISARHCPMLTNTRICLCSLVVHEPPLQINILALIYVHIIARKYLIKTVKRHVCVYKITPSIELLGFTVDYNAHFFNAIVASS